MDKLRTWGFVVLPAVLLATLGFAEPGFAQKGSTNNGLLEAPIEKKDLYPANADAKKEVEEALGVAADRGKRVLLVFGANWCYDCHVLDRALHSGDAGRIVRNGFALVHIDIGEADKNLDLVKKYKIPLEKGVPAIAILNKEGQLLYSSGDGEFEAARSMRKKDLIEFLERWRETERPAGKSSERPLQ